MFGKVNLYRYVVDISVIVIATMALTYAGNIGGYGVLERSATVHIISREDYGKIISSSLVIEPNPIDFGLVVSGGTGRVLITLKNIGEYPIHVNLEKGLWSDLDPSIGRVWGRFVNTINPGEVYQTHIYIEIYNSTKSGIYRFNIYINATLRIGG